MKSSPRPTDPMSNQNWCCFPGRSSRPAVLPRRRWDPFTARPTARSISICPFTMTSRPTSIRRGTSPRPTSSPMRSGTMSRISLASATRWRSSAAGSPRSQYNRLSVKLELQADCLAGVWANHADRVRQVVEPGDIEEALNAASNIGDDRQQRRSQGRVTPDSFTHGTSAQRVSWFRRGFQSGNIGSCDTFKTDTSLIRPYVPVRFPRAPANCGIAPGCPLPGPPALLPTVRVSSPEYLRNAAKLRRSEALRAQGFKLV